MKTETKSMDAGEAREYLARNYGRVLSEGGNADQYFRAVRFAKRLARMIGQDVDAVIATARADYEAAEC